MISCSSASKGGVEITPFEICEGKSRRLLLSLLASLFWQEQTVNVGQNTTSSDGDTAEQLAQLLIIAHCQLDVAGHNTSLLVVTSGVACQLKHLSRKVLQYCCLQSTSPDISNL